MDIVVMGAIWIVMGVLLAALAPNIFKGERPYGERNDYLLSVIVVVITGLMDWFVLPLINIEGGLRFAVAILEPPLAGLAVLWFMRYWKKRQA